jgi:hypothetical protein
VTEPVAVPAPGDARRSTLQTLGLFALGFAGFYVALFFVVITFVANGSTVAVVALGAGVVGAAAAVRALARRRRDALAPLAVGAGAALVVFGGCTAILASGAVRVGG